MARYIVLEYEDRDEAEAAIQQFNEATKKGKRYRVVGYFAAPKLFACRCGKWESPKYRRPKSQRGERFGWWLCGTCNKPRAGGHQLNNLLPLDKILGRGPSGMMIGYETEGYHYEWKVAGLSIFEVPLDNINRKKKWRLKR